jgi:hypothetical protein
MVVWLSPNRLLVPVRGETMMVLWMVVVGVSVEVQRRHAARRRDQDQSEEKRADALHKGSVRNTAAWVKPTADEA